MSAEICRFEEFELNRSAYQLRWNGRPRKLERIPLDLLFLLIDRRGDLVTRAEILERIWGKNFFFDSDNAINSAVRKIRRALRDDPIKPRFVVTVPTKGYRFIAAVQESGDQPRSSVKQISLTKQSSIVGRDRELTALFNGLEEVASGRGRLFLVSGEPGIGKSRLAAEIAAMTETKGIAVLLGHCSEEKEVPFLPFVEMLEKVVDRAREPEKLREQFAEEGSELARLVPKLKRIVPDLPPPLDLPPEQARRHLFNCFFDFVARIAAHQKALVIVEDLHWADDDSTLSLFDYLAQRISDLPVMLLGTFRDAEIDLTPGLKNTLENILRGRLASRIKLKGLPHDEVAKMLDNLSGKSTPLSVVGEIFAETEGNPFFIEELFDYLEEENRLFDSSGQFRSELRIAELEVPPGVQLVVTRRLARLSDSTQKMLSMAAVIGRSFSLDLLQASRPADADELSESLEEAEKAGLVLSIAKGSKARFQFAHELIRQAVIGGLATTNRQRNHLQVANAIEQTYAHALEDYWGELAFHYNRSADAYKAVYYLANAATQAARRTAHAQAVTYIASALERLQDWPIGIERVKQEIALQLTLGPLLEATLGPAAPETERAYARAFELCREVDDPRQRFRVMSGLWAVYQVQAKFEAARNMGMQLLVLAQRMQYPLFLLAANEALGTVLLWVGEFTSAREHLEQGSTFYDPKQRRSKPFRAIQDPGVDCLSFTALALWYLGYTEQARQKIGEAIALARELAHPYTLAYAFAHASLIQQKCRQVSAARKSAEEAIAICSRHGFPFFLGIATVIRGWTLAHDGQAEKGIAQILEGIDIYKTTGSGINGAQLCLSLAEAYDFAGNVSAGFKAAEKALDAVEKTGERRDEAETHRLLGVLSLRSRPTQQGRAEDHLRKAIEVARHQSSKSCELRATISLAQLLRDNNRRDEASTMLTEIFGWFTEGFDTTDLKEAKAMLNELSK
jgi:DNA-binding winged helix-turn-helix (wHTH) protein/predicted ATPase